jgi:hypothetical protein
VPDSSCQGVRLPGKAATSTTIACFASRAHAPALAQKLHSHSPFN